MVEIFNPIYDVSDDYCNMSGRLLKGIVKDTKDDKNLSRVRVDLGRWTENIPEDKLPYALPLFGLRGQAFPKIDETVLIISTSEDLKSLFYTMWPGNSEFSTNNLHGFVDNFGSLFVYDTESGKYTFHHKSGSKFTIDNNGKLSIVVNDLDISALNSINLKTSNLKMSCDNLDIQAKTSITEATVNKTNIAAMITDTASGSPNPEQPEALQPRGD